MLIYLFKSISHLRAQGRLCSSLHTPWVHSVLNTRRCLTSVCQSLEWCWVSILWSVVSSACGTEFRVCRSSERCGEMNRSCLNPLLNACHSSFARASVLRAIIFWSTYTTEPSNTGTRRRGLWNWSQPPFIEHLLGEGLRTRCWGMTKMRSTVTVTELLVTCSTLSTVGRASYAPTHWTHNTEH